MSWRQKNKTSKIKRAIVSEEEVTSEMVKTYMEDRDEEEIN